MRKLFHFECFAVLSIDTNDHDPEGEPDSPELRGFWLTQEAAEQAIETMKAERTLSQDRQDENWRRQWGPWVRPLARSTVNYVVVPYSDVNSKHLSELEDDLETAAAMRGRGVMA